MIIVRQSTARIVTVGPVLDASGVAVTDCVVGDFKIAKNGGSPAALNGSATLTHRATGHYSLSLTTSDLDTVGQAEVIIDDTVNACPVKELTVVEEAVYDALFAASAPGYVANAPVNVAQFGGANGTFASGRPEVNTTHWAGTAVGSTTVRADLINIAGAAVSSSTAQLGVNIVQISGDATAADNAEAFFDGTGYSGANNTIPTVTSLTNKTGFSLASTGLDLVTAWTVAITGNITGNLSGSVGSVTGNVGGHVVGNVNGSIAGSVASVTGNVGGNVVGSVASVTGSVGGNVSGNVNGSLIGSVGGNVNGTIGGLSTQAKADVNAEADAALADIGLNSTVTGRIDVAVSSRGTGTALDAAGVRSAVGLAAANLDTQIAALAAFIDTEVAAILADTNELQTDWANGGRLDLLLDSIIAAIAALNNLSAAQVNAEVVDALATDTYAEPTAVLAATASLKDKIGWICALARNKIVQTSTTQTVYRDDGSTTLATSTHADDGTSHTRGEFS